MEGIIPALESAHALAALSKLTFKENETVVVNLSGRGDKDMEAYRNYIKNKPKLSENTISDPKNVEKDLWRARYSVPENNNQMGMDELNGLYVP
jgi:threonine synthase